MTVQDKVGQLFMIGFEGTHLSQEFIAWLQEYRPGGVILFSRNVVNPAQIAHLTNSLQEHAPHSPLLIAIDQEGGRVSRLPPEFTIFPSAATVSACHSTELAYAAAATTAVELRAVGINMNMAPVLDVNTNPSNPIINDRAFGAHPDQVCTFGSATIAGLQDNKVIACGKHFPGHGETTTDSHKELSVVNVSGERLEQVELRPFYQAIEQGVATIMSAHVRYPALDEHAVATLSRPILTNLLRTQLRFQGVTLTDDLEMNAILMQFSVEEAAIRALQAGADMLVICHKQDRQSAAMLAVKHALEEGRLAVDSINASLDRLRRLKEQFLLPYQPANLQTLTQVVGIKAHRELLDRVRGGSDQRPGNP